MTQQEKTVPRLESASKVAGTAVFLDDMALPGLAHGMVLRSPYAHARVISLDVTAARALEGVLGVLLPENAPDVWFNCTGFLPSPALIKDERVLTREPKHQGDRIAAVVAESPEICRQALDLIRVEYEELPAVLTIEDAMKKNAPLVHPERFDTNVFYHKEGVRGDVEEGFRQCDHVFEGVYYTPIQHPIPMEPISCIGSYTRDDKIVVWANTQTPYQDRRILGEIFSLPECDISVRKVTMGSGFGQREELHNQDIAVALSKLIYRPVKIVNDRDDEMISTATRHSSRSEVKIGVTSDGRMLAYHQTMYTNAGAYCTHSPLVTGAPDRKCPYNVPHYRYDGISVFTNGPVSGAFRGYGNPQLSFGREMLINELCAKLGWDPVKFRYDNVLKPGQKMHANKLPLSTFPAQQVFENGERIRAEIDAREGLIQTDTVREAWGFALISHCSATSSLEALCSATILVHPDGTASVMSGTVDMGQGSETAMVQIVANQLGIEVSDVVHAELNTTTSPYNYGSFSSGQVFLSGNAVAAAAQDVLSKLRDALAKEYSAPPEEVLWQDFKFQIVQRGVCLGFRDAVKAVSRDCRGTFLIGDAVVGMEDCPPPFALCWAKVAVDTKKNTLRLKHIIESVDIGRCVNRQIVEGQLEGAIQMGVGFVLMEDLEVDKTVKKVTAADLLSYRNPLITDMPEIHLYIADSYEPFSASGAKSVGELGVIPVAPAVVEAVNRATGGEIRAFPLSREYFIENNRYDDFFEKGV